jgi:hypothetical protein
MMKCVAYTKAHEPGSYFFFMYIYLAAQEVCAERGV